MVKLNRRKHRCHFQAFDLDACYADAVVFQIPLNVLTQPPLNLRFFGGSAIAMNSISLLKGSYCCKHLSNIVVCMCICDPKFLIVIVITAIAETLIPLLRIA
jgi:hypothetical protein